MEPIDAGNYSIFFDNKIYQTLNQFIDENKPSKIAFITDKNTSLYCKDVFLKNIERLDLYTEICINPGEEHKILNTCTAVWEKLSENNFDRKSLIINLGGGVVTDLGGFVASTFLRGIDFINVPTSLLAMVDASVGGKTGVDLGILKNQIGLLSNPKMVLIDTAYLKSLPTNQFNSGVAEVLKHGLIHSTAHWKTLKTQKIEANTLHLSDIIYKSVKIKNNIVKKDFYETGVRKSLNFGHTLGHAIESYSLSGKSLKPLLHGEAIAIGMVLEAYLSHIYCGLTLKVVNEIKAVFSSYFKTIHFNQKSIEEIISLLIFDKKNNNKQINFVLLEKIGKPVFNIQISNTHIFESFKYYLE